MGEPDWAVSYTHLDVYKRQDLMYEEGKKEEMFGKLQIKLGKTKEELHRIFDSL